MSGVPILNASGCLDALVAPEVATSLDAFVTKTVTPLARRGNPPPRIAETDQWMLNSIGLQNPGIDGFCADVLPELRALEVPLWVSVGGFSASDYRLVCERLDEHDGGRGHRAEPLLPERRGGSRNGVRARRRLALRDLEDALREAFARELRHRVSSHGRSPPPVPTGCRS